MSDMLSLFFGKKKRRPRKGSPKRSPGRRPKRGHLVKKLPKGAYVIVRGRKRKLHRGSNGGLYYRTKSGRSYVPSSVLRRKSHLLSPKKRRVRRAVKKLRRRKQKKLKMTKAAKAARRAYRLRKKRMSRFGLW